MEQPKQVAVITGSSRGWGRAIAEALASVGVSVVVNGISEEVDRVVEEIIRNGGDAIGIRVPSDNPVGTGTLLERTLQVYGKLDIWVNSLGLQDPQPLLSLQHSTWEDIIRVQLTSVFLGSQQAAQQMVRQGKGGRIINVIGGGAYGIPGASAHAASKGGALSATYSWATELLPHGITVNGIRGAVWSPGMQTYVERMGILKKGAEGDDAIVRELGFYRREEAAPLAVWLASDSAKDVTGFHIGIDGRRIVVYGRLFTEVVLFEEAGWTVEKLEGRLHPALRKLPAAPPAGPLGALTETLGNSVPESAI